MNWDGIWHMVALSISQHSSTECCGSGTMRGPGDSAINKAYPDPQGMQNLGGNAEKGASSTKIL